ncbi:MAG: bifunctional sulfate adenylyltransferase/adenylylsulfate kinase [Nitrospirae bacterium]|nr:bifunctional sulfate adenylyltransferase/adenylylsulfate kinase [Nitrospirota bacterium]
MTTLMFPDGEKLTERLLPLGQAQELKIFSRDYPSWDLTPRQMCDIELLLNGALFPLKGFMGQADYDRVVEEMRLSDGTLWPIPITLDITEEFAGKISVGSSIALRDPEGLLIAVMQVADLWKPDKSREAQLVYGTDDSQHPGVAYLFNDSHPVYVGGIISGVEMPYHYDFKELRHSPVELRENFSKRGWHRIVAFHTQNHIHRAHYEITLRAVKSVEANLLIHPAIGVTLSGNNDHYARVRGYERLLQRYPEQTTALSLAPMATRLAGPRETLWHAIVRRNYGCTHFIVGRSHASPGDNGQGNTYYGPYDAHALLDKYREELGIQVVPFQEMVYIPDRAEYLPADQIRPGDTHHPLSGTEFRRRLHEDLDIPEWFSFPEVIGEMKISCPPRHRQGFTIFLTGLSGAGKSTIAKALMVKLMEMGGRSVTLLDGDIVRKHLSSELGFSREHRDLNILRIGYVASEITKHGGIAICAPIAPYHETRRKVREMISRVGGFITIYVATPIEVCEMRDRKGLYAKARAGVLKQFTGISDPYEVPESAELVIDTQDCLPDEAAQRIILRLEKLGYVR